MLPTLEGGMIWVGCVEKKGEQTRAANDTLVSETGDSPNFLAGARPLSEVR